MDKILIIEDDVKLRNELEKFLLINGYETMHLLDFQGVVEKILTSHCQLVLLDINLPMADGQYICKEVRKSSDIPIVMITSQNTELDELMSMNFGADDFIAKPFNTQILLARIAAILKRAHKNSEVLEVVDCGGFLFYVSQSLVQAGNKSVELTKNEGRILSYLAKYRNQIVARDAIMNHLWDSEMFVDDNTLTVNIARLRAKLEELQIKDVIQTKRGLGYVLNTK